MSSIPCTSSKVARYKHAQSMLPAPKLATRPCLRSTATTCPLWTNHAPVMLSSVQGITCRGTTHCHATKTGTSAAQEDSIQQGSTQGTDVQGAWAYLKDFTVKTFRGLSGPYTATAEKREALRTALLLICQNPWPAAGWVPHTTTLQQQHIAASSAASSQDALSPSSAHSTEASSSGSSSSSSNSSGEGSSSHAGGSSSGEGSSSSRDADGRSSSGGLVMIGLMASDVRMGARAMRDYCAALGLQYSKPESRVPGVASVAAIQGAVYMKYNSQSQVCYVSPYLGKERGVLIQLGVEQLGHFPLGLFDEAMKNSPPPL